MRGGDGNCQTDRIQGVRTKEMRGGEMPNCHEVDRLQVKSRLDRRKMSPTYAVIITASKHAQE